MALPQARVELWQGFVMLTENHSLPDFKTWLGPAASHYERYDFENRYTGMWVQKKIPANWKATSEAFMEAWHSITTHPQLLAFLGDANTRYDLIGDHFNRAITPSGVLSPHVKGKDSDYVLEKMNEFSGGADAKTNRRFSASEAPVEAMTRPTRSARARCWRRPGAGVRGAVRLRLFGRRRHRDPRQLHLQHLPQLRAVDRLPADAGLPLAAGGHARLVHHGDPPPVPHAQGREAPPRRRADLHPG